MKRTTHRSTAGKKLYAVRDKAGKFTDIQTHKRASAADQRKRSKAEGTWVRYAVYVKSGPNAGWMSSATSKRASARALCADMNESPYGDRWAVARIEIHAGCPDPLKRK